MKPLFKLSYGIAIIAMLQGCGPIHPRWQNDSSHDIRITYLKGSSRYAVNVKRGRDAVPLAPVDFQTVDTIEIQDAGQLYSFNHMEILKIHSDCGSGFACWIRYDDSHRLHVSTHAPAISKS